MLYEVITPNIGVQVATKLAADKKLIGAVTHYCSAVALGTVDIYHRFGMPAIVWGAVRITSYNVCYTKLLRGVTKDLVHWQIE